MDKSIKNTLWITGISLGVLAIGIAFRHKITGKIKMPVGYKWTQDDESVKKIQSLHPKFRHKVARFFTKIEKETGLVPKATSGYRTIEHQRVLYNKDPRNAKPGYSNHNYGTAVDINLYQNGSQYLRKASSKSKWLDSGVVKIAKDMGMKWGGDFKNYYDPIHFTESKAPSTTEMLALYNQGKVDSNGYVKYT